MQSIRSQPAWSQAAPAHTARPSTRSQCWPAPRSMWRLACGSIPSRLAAGRLARLRVELVRHDYGAALLSDPINIRYATGSRNMAVWTMHAPGRYVFVPVDGPVVLFEFATSKHVQSRTTKRSTSCAYGTAAFFFLAGPRTAEMGERWSREIVALTHSPTPEPTGASPSTGASRGRRATSKAAGISLFDAQAPAELARMIKRRRSSSACSCRWTSATWQCNASTSTATGSDRKPVVGGAPRDQHRPRRRMDRVSSAGQRPEDQSVVPRMRQPSHRSGRPGRFRHRHGRPQRLPR